MKMLKKRVRPQWIYMAMLGKDNKEAYALGACKEYVLDCTAQSIQPKTPYSSYYAIHYRPVSLSKVQVIVRGLNGWEQNSLHLINLVEKALVMPKTTIDVQTGGIVFRGSKRWLIAPPMLSLYALLIRSGRSCNGNGDLDSELKAYYNHRRRLEERSECKRVNADILNIDSMQMQQARPGLEHILTYGDRFVFGKNMVANWPIGGDDIHGRGIINFSYGGQCVAHPSWYRRFVVKPWQQPQYDRGY